MTSTKNDKVSQYYWYNIIKGIRDKNAALGSLSDYDLLLHVEEISQIEGFYFSKPRSYNHFCNKFQHKAKLFSTPQTKVLVSRLEKLNIYISDPKNSSLYALGKHMNKSKNVKVSAPKIVDVYNSESDIDDEVQDGKFVYIPEKNMCVFNLKKLGVKSFSGDEVHKWFEWYSADSNRVKGGLQRNELARKFNIPKNQMYAMLRALGLTKTSPNVAPWVLLNNRDNLENLAHASLEQIEEEYIALHDRKKEAFYRDQYFKMLDLQKRRENITSSMRAYSETVPFKRSTLEDYPNIIDSIFEINLVSVLSDWHTGAKGHAERMAVGTPYGSDVRQERLGALRTRMVEYRSRFRGKINHIYGMILGDMIDDPLARTFPNQAMEQDITGAAQIVEAVRSLSDHILFHYELFNCPMTWHLVVGNHGYEFESVLYYWLVDHLKEWSDQIKLVPVTSRYASVVDPFSSTQIIGLHGDGGVNTAGISMMLAGGQQHQLILHGHKHHLQVEEIPRGFRVMCPSLMGGNAYSQGFGADSRAGQVMVELYADGPRPAIYLPVK